MVRKGPAYEAGSGVLSYVRFIRGGFRGWGERPGRVAGVLAEGGGEVDSPARLSAPTTRLRRQAITCGPVPVRSRRYDQNLILFRHVGLLPMARPRGFFVCRSYA
jgi:hypothetical protein